MGPTLVGRLHGLRRECSGLHGPREPDLNGPSRPMMRKLEGQGKGGVVEGVDSFPPPLAPALGPWGCLGRPLPSYISQGEGQGAASQHHTPLPQGCLYFLSTQNPSRPLSLSRLHLGIVWGASISCSSILCTTPSCC